ncbi:hypothetical protein ES705_40717 [subsurface metagenome]
MGEEEKAVEKAEEAQVPEERTLYQGFVEEVVTRKFQEKRGDPVGRSCRVWLSQPKPGSEAEKAVYALGDPDSVQELGEALESKYDYHGVSPQPISKEREGEVMGEELGKLVEGVAKEAPHVLPRLGEALKKAGLPGGPLGKLLEVGDKAAEQVEAALGLTEALEGFEPTFKKGGAEDGSMDNGATEESPRPGSSSESPGED